MNNTIIANGAHGCLVSPALLCEDKIPHNKKVVSKIFREKAVWEDEIKEASKIKKIKNYNKYFIVPLKECVVHESQKVIWDKCENLTGKKPLSEKKLYQLIMNYGGSSLAQYINKKGSIEFDEWMNILLKILKCIKVLSENKLVHMDIKLDNIVYDSEKKIVKLIDFGLTTSFDEIYISVYKSHYIYWPIEFIMYEHCIENKVCNINTIINDYMSNIKTDHLDLYKFFGVIKNTPIHSKNVLKSSENISKIDIYSLGVTCMFMYSKLKGVIPKSYKDLVSKMCAINCVERISIDDAIHEVRNNLQYKNIR